MYMSSDDTKLSSYEYEIIIMSYEEQLNDYEKRLERIENSTETNAIMDSDLIREQTARLGDLIHKLNERIQVVRDLKHKAYPTEV